MFVSTSSPLYEFVIHPRQTTTTSTNAPSSSTSTSSPSSSSTSSTLSSSSASSASSATSSGTSSSSSITSSASSTSSSSFSSTSSTSSTSSISTSASATQTPAPSNSNAKLIGGIVGGVIAGLALLSLVSVLFTAYRRRRHDARKRPRNSVFLGHSSKGEADSSQLEAFLSPNLTPSHQHTDSLRSSSVPLLSLNEEGSTRPNSVNDMNSRSRDLEGVGHLPSPYSDHVPDTDNAADEARENTGGNSSRLLPSPYSQDGHGADGDNANEGRASVDSSHSAFLPSPYSQHGHGDEDETESPQPPLLAPKPLSASATPRPDSVLFAPLSIDEGDFSLAALEATMAISRAGSVTPTSRSVDTLGVPSSIPEPVSVTTPATALSAANSERTAGEEAQSSHVSS